MKSFNSRYNSRLLKLGGIENSRRDAINFLNNLKQIKIYTGPFKPGNFYTFNYDPLYKDELSFYDKRPLIFALGLRNIKNKQIELGINFAFLPHPVKITLINKIEDSYKFQIIKNKIATKIGRPQKLDIDWSKIVKIASTASKWAVRSYIKSRIVNPKLIDVSAWEIIPDLDVYNLVNITQSQIHENYYKKYARIYR
jgi:hypothetical protein